MPRKPFYKQWWFWALDAVALCAVLALTLPFLLGRTKIEDSMVPLAGGPPGETGTALLDPDAVVELRLNASFLTQFSMDLETWTDIDEDAHLNEDGSVTLYLTEYSRSVLLDVYDKAVDEAITSILTDPQTRDLYLYIVCSDDRYDLTLTLPGDTFSAAHYTPLWTLQLLCYRYQLFDGEDDPIVYTVLRSADGEVLLEGIFPELIDELSPGPGEDVFVDALIGAEATADKAYSFDTPLVFHGLEITFQSDVSWDVGESGSDQYGGAEVFKVPVVVRNLQGDAYGLNPSWYTQYGPGGDKLDRIGSYFEDDIDSGGEISGGEERTAFMCFLYEGDGAYRVALESAGTKFDVELPIEK